MEQNSTAVSKDNGTHSASVSMEIETDSVAGAREIESQSANLTKVTDHILLLLIG